MILVKKILAVIFFILIVQSTRAQSSFDIILAKDIAFITNITGDSINLKIDSISNKEKIVISISYKDGTKKVNIIRSNSKLKFKSNEIKEIQIRHVRTFIRWKRELIIEELKQVKRKPTKGLKSNTNRATIRTNTANGSTTTTTVSSL